MPDFVRIILLIILFIFCLGVLIVVHELGHFAMAKAFNVYCHEFSLGFGPKIIKKKRKKGETYFSLRAIPFGGYVSMYGEGMEIEPGLEIDPSRSLNGIKKWKRAIILFAGVFNNAILALILLFVTCVCMPQKAIYISPCVVEQNSIAEKAGIANNSDLYIRKLVNDEEKSEKKRYTVTNENSSYYVMDYNATAQLSTSLEPIKVAALLNRAIESYDKISYNDLLHFYEYDPSIELNNGIQFAKEITAAVTTVLSVSFNIQTLENDAAVDHPMTIEVDYDKDDKRVFENIGISLLFEQKYLGFGNGLKLMFTSFANDASAIFRGIGSLFTGSGWKNVGGLISIGVQTSNILANFGAQQFINAWALISVNLAIINLFPFPGLDGWQLLVLGVEAIFHKEIPTKVKSIVSAVGILILFVFMILILVKDVIGLF